MGLSSLAIIMGIIDQLYTIDFRLQALYTQKRLMADKQTLQGQRQGARLDFVNNLQSRDMEQYQAATEQIVNSRMPEDQKNQRLNALRVQFDQRQRRYQVMEQRFNRQESMVNKVSMKNEARLDQVIQQLQAKRKTLETQMQQLQQYVNKGIQRAFTDAYGR
jgi:hypothetical protein